MTLNRGRGTWRDARALFGTAGSHLEKALRKTLSGSFLFGGNDFKWKAFAEERSWKELSPQQQRFGGILRHSNEFMPRESATALGFTAAVWDLEDTR